MRGLQRSYHVVSILPEEPPPSTTDPAAGADALQAGSAGDTSSIAGAGAGAGSSARVHVEATDATVPRTTVAATAFAEARAPSNTSLGTTASHKTNNSSNKAGPTPAVAPPPRRYTTKAAAAAAAAAAAEEAAAFAIPPPPAFRDYVPAGWFAAPTTPSDDLDTLSCHSVDINDLCGTWGGYTLSALDPVCRALGMGKGTPPHPAMVAAVQDALLVRRLPNGRVGDIEWRHEGHAVPRTIVPGEDPGAMLGGPGGRRRTTGLGASSAAAKLKAQARRASLSNMVLGALAPVAEASAAAEGAVDAAATDGAASTAAAAAAVAAAAGMCARVGEVAVMRGRKWVAVVGILILGYKPHIHEYVYLCVCTTMKSPCLFMPHCRVCSHVDLPASTATSASGGTSDSPAGGATLGATTRKGSVFESGSPMPGGLPFPFRRRTSSASVHGRRRSLAPAPEPEPGTPVVLCLGPGPYLVDVSPVVEALGTAWLLDAVAELCAHATHGPLCSQQSRVSRR